MNHPALAALGCGLLIALSVPPIGWWPLGIVGVALLGALLSGRRARTRALLGFLAGMGLYGVTIYWFTEFNFAGGVASMTIEAAFLALATVATPPGGGRRVGWVGALVLQDWLRGVIPFGGVPLGGIALGQAAGPLAPAARIGGELLLTGVTALAAVAVDAAVTAVRRGTRPGRAAAVFPALAAVSAVALPLAGAHATGGRVVAPLRVALVQGGGRRGLRAIQNPPALVVGRQIAASGLIRRPVDLIVWPEDVIAADGPIATSAVAAAVGRIAAAHHAALVAGVTEPVGRALFRNAAVVWDADGRITGRYDKVHRVPFGEYVPGRSLIAHLVSLSVIPRDAIAGHGTGELDTGAGPVGVVISFEVFFSNRARSAVGAGGQVLLVPTNTASYRTSQVPTAEVAADRIRAWETGRDVLMVAPTGLSAVVDSRGRVRQRSRLGAEQVIEATVERRTGRTPYVRWGDVPVLAWAGLLIGGAGALALLDRSVNSGKP